MASPPSIPARPLTPLPIAPTEEAWRAMSQEARDGFLDHANDALSDPLRTMSEGRRHKRAKSRAVDMLGLHFKAMGRAIYLAEELAAVYPGAEVFTPDVLAVLDVEQPEDDARQAWVVVDEGKGLDLVLEVLHHGSRRKDLVENVERYASLGISEYFVYDLAKQQLHGHRLPGARARRYEHIVPQAGRYRSTVLGLDLVLQGGSLRFYHGMAEVIGSDDLIVRLNGMVESLEAKAQDAEARAEQERVRAEQERVRAEQERVRAEQEHVRAEQEHARADHAAIEATKANLLAVIAARGIVDVDEARVTACDDLGQLQGWLLRALSATSAKDLFSET